MDAARHAILPLVDELRKLLPSNRLSHSTGCRDPRPPATSNGPLVSISAWPVGSLAPARRERAGRMAPNPALLLAPEGSFLRRSLRHREPARHPTSTAPSAVVGERLPSVSPPRVPGLTQSRRTGPDTARFSRRLSARPASRSWRGRGRGVHRDPNGPTGKRRSCSARRARELAKLKGTLPFRPRAARCHGRPRGTSSACKVVNGLVAGPSHRARWRGQQVGSNRSHTGARPA